MLTELTTARIPVFDVKKSSDVFVPTMYDRESAIILSMNTAMEEGHISVATGQHRLISVNNPLAHHPDGSQVLFIAQIKDDQIVPWGSSSWDTVIADTEFMQATHAYLAGQAREGMVVDFYYGYVPPTDKPLQNHVYPRGSQTIERAHFHIHKTLDGIIPSRFLDPDDPQDINRMIFMANMAGEACIARFEDELVRLFPKKIIFYERLAGKNGQDITIPRTFFGFSSLQDALQAIRRLEQEIMPDWDKWVKDIMSDYPLYHFPGPVNAIVNPVKQSMAIDASVTYPTEADRQRGSVSDTSPIWVAPFATSTILEMVHGLTLNRLK